MKKKFDSTILICIWNKHGFKYFAQRYNMIVIFRENKVIFKQRTIRNDNLIQKAFFIPSLLSFLQSRDIVSRDNDKSNDCEVRIKPWNKVYQTIVRLSWGRVAISLPET